MGCGIREAVHYPFIGSGVLVVVSFALLTFFFVAAFLIMPHPLPTTKDIASMPWCCRRWSRWSGSGLCRIDPCKRGRGAFVGLTVAAALITSVVIDHFGWFRMDQHPINLWRALGGYFWFAG